jgi:hypothetical protein
VKEFLAKWNTTHKKFRVDNKSTEVKNEKKIIRDIEQNEVA